MTFDELWMLLDELSELAEGVFAHVLVVVPRLDEQL